VEGGMTEIEGAGEADEAGNGGAGRRRRMEKGAIPHMAIKRQTGSL